MRKNQREAFTLQSARFATSFPKHFRFSFCILPGATSIFLESLSLPLKPKREEGPGTRHCPTPEAVRQDLQRAVRWSSSLTPQNLFGGAHRLPDASQTLCMAGSLLAGKSVGVEGKGSAAFQRSEIRPNTQQRLALMRGYLPACAKLSFRVRKGSTTAIHTGFFFLSTKLLGLVTPFLSSSTPLVMYTCIPHVYLMCGEFRHWPQRERILISRVPAWKVESQHV